MNLKNHWEIKNFAAQRLQESPSQQKIVLIYAAAITVLALLVTVINYTLKLQIAQLYDQALTNAGLIMKVAGATSSSSGNVRAISQSYAEGEELAAGTVVVVQFGDSTVLD